MDKLVADIQAEMTPEQIAAIAAMQITQETAMTILQELGITLGGPQGGGGNAPPGGGQPPQGTPPAGGMTPPDSRLRRWVGRALCDLQKSLPLVYRPVLIGIQQWIDELPAGGGKRLFELWKQVPVEKSARDEPLTPSEQLHNLGYLACN
jgi:hypothetical protein